MRGDALISPKQEPQAPVRKQERPIPRVFEILLQKLKPGIG